MDRRREERFRSNLVIQVGMGYGVLRDLSASGVYFTTDQSFAVGDALTFAVEFRGAPTGPVAATCKARVLRVEAQGPGANGIAASISDIQFRRIPG